MCDIGYVSYIFSAQYTFICVCVQSRKTLKEKGSELVWRICHAQIRTNLTHGLGLNLLSEFRSNCFTKRCCTTCRVVLGGNIIFFFLSFQRYFNLYSFDVHYKELTSLQIICTQSLIKELDFYLKISNQMKLFSDFKEHI